MSEYSYVGDVTLKEFAEIKKAFPDLMGISVTESEGKQYIALGVPSELGDKACGMYQSIVTLFFDDDLRKRVADVIWDDAEIEALLGQTELLLREHKRQMNNICSFCKKTSS